MGTTYQQATLAVADPETFRRVREAIVRSFSLEGVQPFLKTLERRSLRIREFERVLGAGALGDGTGAEYGRLADGDQGQIRELYLHALEQVPIELRNRFFKLYAYY